MCTLSACAFRGDVAAVDAQSVELDDTPFFAQRDFFCGPSALAMVLHRTGVNVKPDALVESVYIPERKGSLQVEMVDLLLHKAREGDTRAIRFILERRCGWRNEKTVHHTETVDPKLKLERIEADLEAGGYDLEEVRRLRRRPASTMTH